MRYLVPTLLCVIFFAVPVGAQTFTVPQDLNFGDFALRNNNGVYSITVTTAGNITGQDYNFMAVDISAVSNAILRLEGYLANTDYNVAISFSSDPVTVTCSPSPHFSVGTFTDDLSGGMVTTDGAGDADILQGATLSTDGLGGAYSGGVCSSTYTITVILTL